jgi:hypothetical protein
MIKEQKVQKPKLLPRMIVAGTSLLIMIFAAAGYAAARSEFGVGLE